MLFKVQRCVHIRLKQLVSFFHYLKIPDLVKSHSVNASALFGVTGTDCSQTIKNLTDRSDMIDAFGYDTRIITRDDLNQTYVPFASFLYKKR